MKRVTTDKKYLPFICLLILLFYFHFFIVQSKTGDDVFFQEVLKNQGMLTWLKSRYLEWSSRTVIEFLLALVSAAHLNVWRIINISSIMLIAYCLSYMFNSRQQQVNNWYVVLLILCYPIYQFSSAGWIATTINYLWPLAFGLVGLIPIIKYFRNEKIKLYEYPIYLFSLLLACNQEQLCLIIVAFYTLVTGYSVLIKKINGAIIIQLFISIASLVFILLSPGNNARSMQEINTWFPFFKNFSLVDKLSLGFTTSFSALLRDNSSIFSIGIRNLHGETNGINLLFFIFSLCLIYLVYSKSKKISHLSVAAIPLLFLILFNGIFDGVFIDLFKVGKVTTIEEFNMLHFGGINYIFSLFIGCILTISILFSFYLIFPKKEVFYIVSLIFLAGLCSRIIIGLSPTIFASSLRTATFLNTAVLICVLYQINQIRENRTVRNHIKS